MHGNEGFSFEEIDASCDAVMARIVRDNLERVHLNIPGTAYYDEGLDRLSASYGTRDKKYYCLKDVSGNIVGGVGFMPLSFMEDTAELQKLYLAESVKGKGLGYVMLSFIEERMRDAGFKHVYLETHENLDIAIHLYLKCGYYDIERPAEVVHSTMNRFMVKDL